MSTTLKRKKRAKLKQGEFYAIPSKDSVKVVRAEDIESIWGRSAHRHPINLVRLYDDGDDGGDDDLLKKIYGEIKSLKTEVNLLKKAMYFMIKENDKLQHDNNELINLLSELQGDEKDE